MEKEKEQSKLKKIMNKEINVNINFTIVAIILIAIFCICITPVTFQNDTFYTIKIGEYIKNNGIDMMDHFSWHENLSYTYPHWLYDLCTFLVYSMAGFRGIYVLTCILSAILGIFLFTLNPNINGQITNPTILNSIILGFLVSLTAIVPGVEPTVLLSTLGYYELYVNSLANLNLIVIIPMLIGLAIGGIVVSYIITKLFKHCYTLTYAIIFGSFLSMIPNILNETCKLGFNIKTYISIGLIGVGFIVSYYFGSIRKKRKAKKRSNNK